MQVFPAFNPTIVQLTFGQGQTPSRSNPPNPQRPRHSLHLVKLRSLPLRLLLQTQAKEKPPAPVKKRN